MLSALDVRINAKSNSSQFKINGLIYLQKKKTLAILFAGRYMHKSGTRPSGRYT